jgi:Methyltransferase domain
MQKASGVSHALRALIADPVRVVRALPGELSQKRGPQQYGDTDLDDAWFEHLHGMLGAAWPCPEIQELNKLLDEIGELLATKGLGTGRHTYGWYSDAESALCGAIWCVARHARPEVVIETGVAHGVSSRVVLEALTRNDRGRLWSIDLPHPLNHALHATTGVAVTDSCRGRWTYLEGESRRRLPPLVAEVGTVHLFIHDSLHTAKNTLFEMEQAASVMPPGGVMLVDDIRGHDGFSTFARRHPGYQTLICPTPDNAGVFGIAINREA